MPEREFSRIEDKLVDAKDAILENKLSSEQLEKLVGPKTHK